jgi:cytochrome c oxidase subunit 1
LIIWSTVAAAILSFVVWAHHMFVSGMDPRLVMPFSITTILISVPCALIIFAMIATLWKGSMSFPTPLLFALGTLMTLIIGGITGIFLGSAPTDIYFHDTYFVVAHFHYTLFPSTILGGFAALYYWFPKMFGRMMNNALGKIHFWGTIIFFNLTIFPIFYIGTQGSMRRMYDATQYDFLKPLQPLNEFVTICSIILLLTQIPFVINLFWSIFKGRQAEQNPWKANTLEWAAAPSPPPHGNYKEIPTVYRGAYEYSKPDSKEDWLPQHQPEEAVAAT